MNRLIIPHIFICLFFFLLSCSNDEGESVAYEELIKYKVECMNMPRPAGSYNYPVYPGMTKWNNFTETQQMIDTCQVPTKVLKQQSTQAVFQALWEYPFYPEAILRAGYYQKDFETIFLKTNAYEEFIKRDDSGICLLERLQLVNPVLRGATFEPKVLELFISQPVFLSQLTELQLREVIRSAFDKDDQRQQIDSMANSVTREVTWLLIGRTLVAADYQPFMELIAMDDALQLFLKTTELYVTSMEDYDAFFDRIIFYGKDYIN